jgi:glycosyltransferase involved in cell wall biosynthesis
MSTFPPYSETFVMREIRELRKQGCDVHIGCLRPLHQTPAAAGFEDLAAITRRASWLSLDLLLGLLVLGLSRPNRLLECLRLIAFSLHQPVNFAKLTYLLLASARLAYQFRNASVTLIRAHFLHSEAVAACFLGILMQVPYSVTVYTTHVLFPDALIRRVVNGARFLVADTAQSEEFLLSLGCKSTLIHRIYNSVDVAEFPDRGPQSANSVPVILAVGRLDPKKGFHVLLEACALLRDRGLPFKAILIGEGPERARLLALRRTLNLEGHVDLLGKLSFTDTKTWLYRATLLVMPSVIAPSGDTDGLPTVIIEAMASALPVIGTTIGAIPEVVFDGKTGILVPANAPKQLADQVERLFKNDSFRILLGAAGRTLVAESFNLSRKAKILSELFDRYCASEHQGYSAS